MITVEKIIDEVNRLILLDYNYPIYFENIPEVINANSFGINLLNYKVTSINKNTNLENVELLITYLAQSDSSNPNNVGKEKYKIVDKLKTIFGKGNITIEDRTVKVSVEYKEVINKLGICLNFEYFEDAFISAETVETIGELSIKQGL